MIKSLSISHLLKLSAIIALAFLTLLISQIFSKNPAHAASFSGNLGVGSTAPSSLFVTVTNPVSGSGVSGTVNIRAYAQASGSATVTRLEFYTDNSLLGISTSAPYSQNWDTTVYPYNSSHTIFAEAFDDTGNIATSSAVTVTVLDVTPPQVSLTSPLNGSTVNKNSTVAITANASDLSGISRVEFYVNGRLLCSNAAAAYSCNWQVPAKPKVSYTLQAKAYDAAGNTSVATSTVTSK